MRFKNKVCPVCKTEFLYKPMNTTNTRTYCTRKCKDTARRDKENPLRKKYTGISKDKKKYMREYMKNYRQLSNN